MLKTLWMAIWNRKSDTETTFVSQNCRWTTRRTTVKRTICGIPLWTISTRDVPHSFGEPYVAKL